MRLSDATGQRRRRELTRRWLVGLVALLFAGITGLRYAYGEAADAPLVLFVVPVAICAIAFGARGGLLGALAALGILLTYEALGEHALGALGIATRATAYFVVGGLVGRFVDERRVLQAELERHFDLSLDLCCAATFEGRFERVNPAARTLLGYDPEELANRPFLDFVHPDDHEATQREAAKLATGLEDTVNFRNRYRRADGCYRWLEWNCRGFPELKRIYGIARDVTEQRESEAALQHQSDQLERAVRERTRALEEARLDTLQRLAVAAEYRDDNTYQHTERVGRTAALLARELGLDEESVALIRVAAPLHDVGKLGVSDSILLKPGPLTEEELLVMREHTAIGARILDAGKFAVIGMGYEIALSHHERWDGTGYPRRLAGEAIPLFGRIVAVADVFDALTHDRPYKHAWPVEDAVAEIIAAAGTQFDPRIVEAFARLDHPRLVDSIEDFDLALPAPPLRAARS